MARRLIVLLTWLAIPALVCGCSAGNAGLHKAEGLDGGPEAVQPDRSEADKAATIQVEPDAIEPVRVGRGEAEPDESEPNGVKPGDDARNRAASFHAQCAAILSEFVDEQGLVDYKGLRRKRLELKALLNRFDALDPNEYKSWPEKDKMAFWINAYNLQKLKVVTDNYPIEPSSRILTIYWGPRSLRHIEQKIRLYKFLVMDEEFTFAGVENRFFRGRFDDPRVFFALSSACLSSSPLRNEPYTGDRLDEQLDDQTRKFLASPLTFRIDRERQKVYLSALFQLSSYGKEFADKYAIGKKFKDRPPEVRAVLNFISTYASRRDVSFLEVGHYTIEYMTFDWTINDGS